jgi:hypothetical protein
MPEVFQNTYTFNDPTQVPPAEKLHTTLATYFKAPLTITIHPLGEHGAMRAYATLESPDFQIWAYWEPTRPEMELTIDRPMERMLTANAAMLSLAGKPRYPDSFWHAYRRSRTHRKLRKILFTLLAIAAAIATIYTLHWWGLLIVFLITAAGVFLFILLLARSFRR